MRTAAPLRPATADRAQRPAEPREAAQGGQRPRDAGRARSPGSVLPSTRPTTNTAAPASRHRTTIHSASRTNGGRRQQHAQRRAGERERRTAVHGRREHGSPGRPAARGRCPTPSPRNGRTMPASTPTASAASTARGCAGDAALRPEPAEQRVHRRLRRPRGWTAGAGAAGRRGLGLAHRLALGLGCRLGGRSTRTRAPVRPGSGSTKRMVPPCRSVTQRAMARPRPVPPPPSVVGQESSPEPLEDPVPVGGRDAGPVVGDLEPPAAVPARRR